MSAENFLSYAKATAFLCLGGMFLSIGLLADHARQDLSSFRTTLQPLVQKITLDLDELHRVELEAGLTAMEARKASAEERAALPKLTAQVEQTLQNVNTLLVSVRQTSDGVGASQQQITQSTVKTMTALNDAIFDIQPVLYQTQQAIADLRPIEAGVNRQVNDPAVTEILHHIDSTTASVEATTRDLQGEVYSITHPGWAHRAWGWALDVAHAFNPL